ncbi:MAG: hypothetical protein U0794_05575 [Isosphaeraceae bacterium]
MFALCVGWVCCLLVALTPDPEPPFVPPPQATSDLDFYGRVVQEVASGVGYHDAAHRLLLELGYPSRSVFNWRLPTYAWLFAFAPSPAWCRAVLILGALLTVLLWSADLLRQDGIIAAGVGGVFLVGALAWCCASSTYLFTELWAGVLIALSLAAFRRNGACLGVALGIAAVLFRELAAPYLVISLLLALRRGRLREALGWSAGLLVFAAYLGCHAWIVWSRLTPLDQALAGGWIRFQGVRFVLVTAQANVFLMSLPLWATALFVPLATLGLMFWDGEQEERVRACGLIYLAAFCVVGASFNFYWGFVYTPILALGVARAPAALGELLRRARRGGKARSRPETHEKRTESRRSSQLATGTAAR